jgi:hypothetical protein
MPKKSDDPRVHIHVYLQPELNDRLRAAAEERMVGVNLMITKAIENFLDHLIPVDKMV